MIIRTILFIFISTAVLTLYPPFAAASCHPKAHSGSCSGFTICSNNPAVCCNPASECVSQSLYTCDPTGGSNNYGIKTPFGCMPVFNSKTGPIQPILDISTRISAGIAILLFAYAGFVMITSSGNPKKMQLSKEIVAAVLGGIAFIALSLVLLNYLGVTILHLGPLGFRIV